MHLLLKSEICLRIRAICRRAAQYCTDFTDIPSDWRNSGTRRLRPPQQSSSRHVQVHQSASHEQPVGVLVQAPITDLVKTKYPLEDQEWMLNPGADARLGVIFRTPSVRQCLVATAFLLGKVLRPRRMFADHFTLSGIGRVTPDAGLTAMQQVRQHLAVMHIGRRLAHRVDQFAPAVHPDMRLHPKIPLIAFLRLMHLRVPLPVLVLRRTRRADNGGIDDGTGIYLHPILMQILGNQGKQPVTKIVPFQKVAKLADRRLVRRRLPPQVDAHKTTHRPRIVQRLFHSRVRQIEPVLQKVNAQHALNTHRRSAPALPPGIEGLNHRRQLRPRYDPVHLFQKLFPAGRFAVLLETFFGKGTLAHLSVLRSR